MKPTLKGEVMFKSIFRKMFVMYFGTIVLSFSLMGAALSYAFRSYFINQKETQLIDHGQKISQIFEQSYATSLIMGGLINTSQLNSEVSILYKYLDASFIYIDKNYNVLLCSGDISDRVPSSLNLEELAPLLEGNRIRLQGDLSDIYKHTVLTVGYPVIVNGETMGGILMSSSMPELQKTISDVFRLTFTFLCVSLWLAFALVYFTSRNITRPLREMNEAAKVIANGDFEKRISVKTRDEVGQLAKSFNDMAESLNHQEIQRRDFLANISHDIRSPLTSIRGFLYAIIDGTIPNEKQSYYLSIVLEETERLSQLANDILDLNKVTNLEQDIELVSFDFNQLIRKVITNFEARIMEKNLNVELVLADEVNVVYADYDKIHRVVYNLLDNAIKFTKESITVETKIQSKRLYVIIGDDGPGLAAEELKKIFERFYKGDASRGLDKKGSGLGLSIAKEFIKAHGETIKVESREGEGCKFVFSLKLAEKSV